MDNASCLPTSVLLPTCLALVPGDLVLVGPGLGHLLALHYWDSLLWYAPP
jgi:hypothetical protein